MGPKFLVVTGDGVNCERETSFALEQAGGECKIIHINDLLETPKLLHSYQGLIFPGGFSFGDELGSGQILALKMRYGLGDELSHFLERPKAVLGICNGFQVLVKLGILPFKSTSGAALALDRNRGQRFIDRWVDLEVNTHNKSPWLNGLPGFIPMPVRHGEGKLTLPKNDKQNLAEQILEQNLWAFRYLEDINGSFERIAGLTDPSGWVLGLMPHPEAASFAPQQGSDARSKKTLPAFNLFSSIIKSLKSV